MVSQVAGYTLSKSTNLNISIDEAIECSNKASSFLVQMTAMIEPQHIKSNEIIKDVYQECLLYKEYLSELLWIETNDDLILSIQSTLDDLSQAIIGYETTNEIIDAGWEFVEISSCVSTC